MLSQVRCHVQGARAECGRGDLRRPVRAQIHDVTCKGPGGPCEACGSCAATKVMDTMELYGRRLDAYDRCAAAASPMKQTRSVYTPTMARARGAPSRLGFEISGTRVTPQRPGPKLLTNSSFTITSFAHVVHSPHHLRTPYNGCTRSARFGVFGVPPLWVPRAGGCGPVRASPRDSNCSGSLSPPDGHGSRGRAGKGRRNGCYRQLPLRNAAQYGAT